MSRVKYQCQEDGESNNNGEPTRVFLQNGHTHSTSLMHNNMVVSSSLSKRQETSKKNPELQTQRSHMNHAAADLSISSVKKEPGNGHELGMVRNNLQFIMSFIVSSSHKPTMCYLNFSVK